MAKEIKTIAHISRIVRNDGKANTQITISVPTDMSGEIPLGSVNITIVPSQQAMELGGAKPVRGDRG
jgi:hypothetical protein